MFTYELPSHQIAQEPCAPRDAARLLVLNRATGSIDHRIFSDLPGFLRAGDCLVLNDTKVLPARLYGKKVDTGGAVELLILAEEQEGVYRCLGQPGKRLLPGSRLSFNGGSVTGQVLSSENETRLVRFEGKELRRTLNHLGVVPLPPYIKRKALESDAEWYQTVYAAVPGAVAAPTAGLHFTGPLLEKIRASGVRVLFVTLHVGWGTFKPVTEAELQSGRLHEERFEISEETVQAINGAKAGGGRIVAVGTTTVRALESAVSGGGLSAAKGTTGLFIRDPFDFRVVDALITNFHLPGTSLLHLVAAFAGAGCAKAAYEEAVRKGYRFYSYGDAMLIL
ncbi:MAG: tRNA preQ1(34) S-adenosylmethionine ribosyltransferase-isomerase QueA [Candidatus Omnitrophica bacterium]|nr:tRNA preQ1(34) S-adenosylmethionine ribosyltransferase-isomerase QueA [Candidatus Omnitrophota bacterium]